MTRPPTLAQRVDHVEADVHETIAPAQARFERELAELRRALADLADALARETRLRGELEADLAGLKKTLRTASK